MAKYSNLRMIMRRCVLVLIAVLFVSCGPGKCKNRVDVSAEEQLRSYIDLAVNITRMDQREELESFTTGEFRDHITSASPEAFKESYLNRRFEFDEFEVTSKKEVDPQREVHLEYRVKFRSWLTGEDKARSPSQDVKSLAVMKYTNGQWAIASIKPLDSSYNWDVGLPMDGVSTQGITPDSPVIDPYAEAAPQAEQAPAVATPVSTPAKKP